MRARNYFSVLAATAVLTTAGAAFSGPTAPHSGLTIHLMDFNQANGELLGYPEGNPPLSWFRHTHQTVHLRAHIAGHGLFGHRGNDHPPGPCTPITEVWNMAVEYEQTHPAAAAAGQDFGVLIALLAENRCSASITLPPGGGTGGDIQSIAPSD